MYYVTNLEHIVFDAPYEEGYRTLRILSGYASSAFLTHILTKYPDLEIELVIGMAKKDGIRRWDHEQYVRIMEEYQNVSISYQKSRPGIHTKIYHWPHGRLLNNSVTFTGSANFSWNGFRDQHELLVPCYFENVDDVFNVTDAILCTDPDVENHINFQHVTVQRRPQTDEIVQLELDGEDTETPNLQHLEYVDLPLLIRNDTAIQERAGLNWGQREGRDPNQAYLKVPTPFNNQHPDFFPPLEQSFTMLTDDGQHLVCKMAQAERKAIHTTENNSIMGQYFRNRLSVPLGERVDPQDVINYGRTSVRVYKIDSETYFMDFSIGAT
ncbi:NgoFVII family restriction endonuclease [Bacillus aerolatus]|uniref:NgoFVII family restriction endonuclease n=1 Tax=Bacillus aerolatus TaxID=2653354 RepID=A0A6I1FGL3_9BACI|nr:restriction endonuclease PLD domain-containing protein [Bacillus aerolatus]KAB7704914.1 NgoFVII family restriction endonuclease [Bacillus aerolatus]